MKYACCSPVEAISAIGPVSEVEKQKDKGDESSKGHLHPASTQKDQKAGEDQLAGHLQGQPGQCVSICKGQIRSGAQVLLRQRRRGFSMEVSESCDIEDRLVTKRSEALQQGN